jgi:hypothetical protein
MRIFLIGLIGDRVRERERRALTITRGERMGTTRAGHCVQLNVLQLWDSEFKENTLVIVVDFFVCFSFQCFVFVYI